MINSSEFKNDPDKIAKKFFTYVYVFIQLNSL